MDQKVELINHICQEIGVSEGYYDIWGNWHPAQMETKESILQALGLPVENPEALEEAFKEVLMRRYEGILGRTTVCEYPCRSIPLRCLRPLEGKIRLTLRPEDGEEPILVELRGDAIQYQQVQSWWGRVFEGHVSLPSEVKEGYYSLLLETEDRAVESLLVVVPEVAFLPEEKKKHWGINLSLYALSSEGSPSGDLGVLKKLSQWVSSQGGYFVLINPLHYNDNRGPSGRSPYYPLSRLYFNPLYIDLKALPWLCPSELEILKAHGEETLIDYERVYKEKDALLRIAFERFLKGTYSDNTPEARSFRAFIQEEGQLLEEFSLYVMERTNAKDEREGLYQKFLQWCLKNQIDTLKDGVFFDLALGTREDGFDLRAFPGALVRGVSVGAPPDDFSPKGQDWGFPPLSPLHLEDTGYRYFIELLKRNIPQGGGVRIDHIAGLQRLFWIPEGKDPKDGLYVYYPLKKLLGLICLESKRKSAVIVGEDLGTVEPSLREEMNKRNIISFKVFYFEKYPDGGYKRPEEYPEKALVTTTTHDLPTLWGFYGYEDIQDRLRIGRYPDMGFYDRDMHQRQKDIQAIRELLKAECMMYDFSDELTQEEMVGIYNLLWRTPCLFVSFFVDDLLGVRKQQNMPGTIEEYPNWSQRYPLRVEEALRRIGEVINRVVSGGRK